MGAVEKTAEKLLRQDLLSVYDGNFFSVALYASIDDGFVETDEQIAGFVEDESFFRRFEQSRAAESGVVDFKSARRSENCEKQRFDKCRSGTERT